MKGIYYDLKIRKAVLKKIGLATKFSMIKYREDWPEPEIKFPRQVKVKTLMSGICASDLHQIDVNLSYAASILARKENPFPMGHELVGEVIEIGSEVEHLKPGDRVVMSPIAHCKAYGFEKCPSCEAGDYQTCYALVGIGDGSELEETYGGRLGFGGFAGGGFSERFLAFEGQLTKVPFEIPDEIAILAEPYSVGIHAVLKKLPKDTDTVVVTGAGIIGLMIIAAIRALGSKCKIITLARYQVQVEAAIKLGSDKVLTERSRDTLYEEIAKLTDGELFKPALGRKILYGNKGPDIVFDSVGSEVTIDDAFRFVRTNGTVIIVGMALGAMKKVDWMLQVYKELDVLGSMMHGLEEFQGESLDTFILATRFLNENQSLYENLVTHKFRVDEYKKAFDVASNKGKYAAIKIAFDYR
ncbi:MAG: medium chain dehydrogenase/reductase family protein [Candidatus Thorarchaeota archaeon]|nr:medium chain dehydrogenase/reductase family protein [Candidatus Thorarchaeota archaeon]